MNWKKLIAIAYSYNISSISEFKFEKDGERYDVDFTFNPSVEVRSYLLNAMALTIIDKGLNYSALTKDNIDSNGLRMYLQALGEPWGNVKSDIWFRARCIKDRTLRDFSQSLYQRVVAKDLNKMSINDILDIIIKHFPSFFNE